MGQSNNTAEIKMAFVNEKEKHQTIDYERNAILMEESHDRENNYHFRLNYNDSAILFSGQYGRRRHENGNLIVDWEIFRLTIPEKSKIKKDQAQELIAEAIEAYGIRHMKKNIEQVNVSFSPTL